MKNLFVFNDVVDRAKKSLKIKEDKELAALIGMSSGSFHNRKKAQSIPFQELLELAIKQNIDFDWLLTGTGNMYRDAVNKPSPAYSSEKTKKMAELFDDLDSDSQREILSRLEEKKRLSELEFIVERLQKKVG